MLYNGLFFYCSLVFYAVAGCLFVWAVSKHKALLFIYSKQWLGVGVLAGLFCLVTRYHEAGHLPLVTLFEITFFYAWLMSVLYLIYIKHTMAPLIQGIALCVLYALLVWDIFIDKTIYPLNPQLESFWLGIHVPCAMLSYSAFALSFAVSIYYLIAERKGGDMTATDSLNTGLIIGGFVLLAICIVTGSIWAKTAWGTYWSWDPKETWALITLIVYGVALAARKLMRLSGTWQAILSIAGFVVMLFTFFGVSLFLASHHAYQ